MVNDIAEIALATYLLLPSTGHSTPFLMVVLASMCYFLKLAVYWAFAFQYWVTASACGQIVASIKSQNRLSGLPGTKKSQQYCFILYLVAAGGMIVGWLVADYLAGPAVDSEAQDTY